MEKSNKLRSGSTQFFHNVGQSWNQIRRSPMSFCLGCFSCFLAVALSVAVSTMISKSPIVFLTEAEGQNGQVDFKLTAAPWQDAAFIDYNKLSRTLAATPFAEELSFHSPRVTASIRLQPAASCTAGLARAGYEGEVPGDGSWMYTTPPVNATVARSRATRFCATSCLPLYCDAAAVRSATLVAIDTAREARMGLGRLWDKSAPPRGSCIMHSTLASASNVKQGDTVLVTFPDAASFVHSTLRGSRDADAFARDAASFPTISMSLVVHDVVDTTAGKLPDGSTSVLFVELGTFGSDLRAAAHPLLAANASRAVRQTVVQQSFARSNGSETVQVVNGTGVDPAATLAVAPAAAFVTEVNVNLPADERVEVYLDSNYDSVQARVTAIASNLAYAVGFRDLRIELPLMDTIRVRRFITLFLGLLLNVQVIILFTLSSMLVYSLLMIDANQRRTEIAIRRMLGTSKRDVFHLLVTQAFAYGIPSWALGLVAAQLMVLAIINTLSSAAGLNMSVLLTASSILLGTALGIGSPLVASIGPIQNALGTSIREALDFARAKTKAVKFSIERAADAPTPWSVVVVGIMATVFGFSVYILLPLSLLSFNLALFFNLFFAVLIGLLLGCVLLALNIESIIERAVAWLFIFWEHRAVRKLALKNLVAHRIRNRKTAIMYSLSLAFIVFINIAASAQVSISRFTAQQTAGAPVLVATSSRNEFIQPATARTIDAYLRAPAVAPLIDSTASVSVPLSWLATANRVGGGSKVTHIGRVYGSFVSVMGVSPSFFNASFDQYFEVRKADETGLDLSELLYTVRGSQRMWLSAGMEQQIGAGIGDPLLFTQGETVSEAETVDGTEEGGADAGTAGGVAASLVRRLLLAPAALLSASPFFDFSRFTSENQRDAVVSFPTYVRLSNGLVQSVRDIPLRAIMLRFTPAATGDQKTAVKAALAALLGQSQIVTVTDAADAANSLEATLRLLDIFFTVLTVVAMALCYFSLLSSMMANIAEQAKEIGVLRAVGLKRNLLLRVYIYEAFVLVMSASLSGILIGIGVGYTFTAQQALFAQLPVPFIMPYITILGVVAAAIVCAICSAYFPARALLRQSVTKILRGG